MKQNLFVYLLETPNTGVSQLEVLDGYL